MREDDKERSQGQVQEGGSFSLLYMGALEDMEMIFDSKLKHNFYDVSLFQGFGKPE